MNKDFTLKSYKILLQSLHQQAFSFLTYNKFITSKEHHFICLRHDVDLLPLNSLAFAQIQHVMGIKGTYYFRAVPESWDESIIKAISAMGHEVGYHYECLTTTKGDMNQAITDFEINLEKLRKLVPVNTICMHGSPRSKYDSKDLWNHYNYQDYGIIGEPYFDTDFSEIAYYTDTGRMWDGFKYSVRDKVSTETGAEGKVPAREGTSARFPVFHTTSQMIHAINAGEFPDRAMMTFHPQRWTYKPIPWLKELMVQRGKNVIKKWFFVK